MAPARASQPRSPPSAVTVVLRARCELERVECLRLLAPGVIGRVVVTDAALPAAQPITYRLDCDEVIFRAGGGSKLAAATRHAVLAVEADEVA